MFSVGSTGHKRYLKSGPKNKMHGFSLKFPSNVRFRNVGNQKLFGKSHKCIETQPSVQFPSKNET